MEAGLNPFIILAIIAIYFLVLMGISFVTGKDADNADFFVAGKKAPWFLVAFGMIGASLSGVTFISIPGVVGEDKANTCFSYMQMVFGYLVGYLVIATILMPVYYRLNLTSIYGYLEQRFGPVAYKTGAAFFLLSRTIGASFRLYLVAIVLDQFVMVGPLEIPFWLTVILTILLVWVYTFRGGIKTIVWTDTLQTLCMLLAVIFTVVAIGEAMGLGIMDIIPAIQNSDYSQMFFFEGGWSDPNNFFKQFISGVFIAIVMTGLDQDMMQKNLACRSLRDAQKNMFWFSVALVFANLLFLGLGALLYLYVDFSGLALPSKSDHLFPMIALSELSPYIGVLFILGLIAAAYSSADSALTSLTTSFCVDFLGFEKMKTREEANQRSEDLLDIESDNLLDALSPVADPKSLKETRFKVHIGFSILLFVVIIVFWMLNNDSVVTQLFKAAGYTYGPLLGLFTFGLFMKNKVNDQWVWLVCLLSPILSYILNMYSTQWFNGLEFGFLILLVNGLITFFGLFIISEMSPQIQEE